MKTLTFNSVIEKAEKLDAYFKSQSLSLHPSSILAQSMRKLHQIQSFYDQHVPDGFDAVGATNDVANLWYLCDAVLGSVGTPFEDVMKPHLALLASGNPMPLKQANRSNERDRVFELICARVCSEFASDVRFEEPDVLATYSGQRWGLACKSAYGNVATIAKAIRKGASQIKNSIAEKGLVVVQLTNIFPHRQMYLENKKTGVISSFNNEKDQYGLFASLIEKLVISIENEGAKLYQKYPVDISNRVRGVLFVTQTASLFRERTTIMAGCRLISHGKIGEEATFGQEFNGHLQSIASV